MATDSVTVSQLGQWMPLALCGGVWVSSPMSSVTTIWVGVDVDTSGFEGGLRGTSEEMVGTGVVALVHGMLLLTRSRQHYARPLPSSMWCKLPAWWQMGRPQRGDPRHVPGREGAGQAMANALQRVDAAWLAGPLITFAGVGPAGQAGAEQTEVAR